jgi:phosphomevalonate kinase
VAIVAKAPGKLVVLGEYAVLTGGAALVMAVDRHCIATLEPSTDDRCHLLTLTASSTRSTFAPATTSGSGLVDQITRAWSRVRVRPWRGSLDSQLLYQNGRKLGLGSSAAALVAWTGAWSAYIGRDASPRSTKCLAKLIELHHAWQGDTGSGLDVAASLLGGVLSYRPRSCGSPEYVSVGWLDSVGFIAITTPEAASTPQLLQRFQAWRAGDTAAVSKQLAEMEATAARGIEAVRIGNASQLIDAVADYGELLWHLGDQIGADIVTAEHAAVARLAKQHGITYKVSGAGGGDIGLGLATDHDALAAFASVLPPGCEALSVGIDEAGLVMEEQAA